LNDLKPGAVATHTFNSMGEFAEVMRNLVQGTRPYKMFA